MSDPTYSLKQVCALAGLSEDPAEVSKLARQIRHWTNSDLLHPQSGKRTGTGVSRRYSADEVRRAAVLVEIARYRVPVPVIESFAEAMDGYAGSPDWQAAMDGTRSVFLQLAWSEHNTQWTLSVDAPQTLLFDPKGSKDLQAADDDASRITSAIVMNLTAIFARVQV
jgi:hypothetical protein